MSAEIKYWICHGWNDGEYAPCAFAPCRVTNDVLPDRCNRGAENPCWREMHDYESA
jgi:hypothetical protein